MALVITRLLAVGCATPVHVEKMKQPILRTTKHLHGEQQRNKEVKHADNNKKRRQERKRTTTKRDKTRRNDLMDKTGAGRQWTRNWKKKDARRQEPSDVLIAMISGRKSTKGCFNPVYSNPYSRIYYNPYLRRYGTIYYPSTFSDTNSIRLLFAKVRSPSPW